MIEKIDNYKTLLFIFVFWLVIEYISGVTPRQFTGWIISAHSIFMCVSGFLIAKRKKNAMPGLWLGIGYILVGLSDFLWGVNYFFSDNSSRSLIGIMISAIISGAFLVFSNSLLLSTNRAVNFIKHTMPISFLLSIIMMAIVLSMPWMMSHKGIIKIFYSVEVFSFLTSFVLLITSSMMMIGSRSLSWSIVGCSFFCFAVGDLSIRVDKVINDTLNFDIYSVLFSVGLYMSLFELWKIPSLESEDLPNSKCLFVSFKSGFLLVSLSTILLFLFFQHKDIDAQRIVIFSACIASFSGIFLSKYFANSVASHSISLASFVSGVEEYRNDPCKTITFPYEVDYYYSKVIKAAVNEKRTEADYKAKSTLAHNISSPIEVQCSILDDREILSIDDIKMIKHSAYNMRDMVNYARSWKSRTTNSEIENLPINNVLSLIIAQKKVEFKTKSNIEFNFNDNCDVTLFTRFSETKLVSIFSNMINNSVESLSSDGGVINLDIKHKTSHATITLSDSGCGIPKENIAKIFQHGFSTKSDGNGIGLHDAKKTIEEIGGEITVQSDGSSFTIITIRLLLCEPPYWHTNYIDFYSQGKIFILDDNHDHHSLAEKIIKSHGLQAEHFYSYNEFASAIKNISVHDKIMMDLQLNGKMDGIEIILKHRLQNNTYLLTSYSDEQSIRDRCNQEKVKLIPKSNFSKIKIFVHESLLGGDLPSLISIDALVLDDQDIVRNHLRKKAKRAKAQIELFSNPVEFYNKIGSFNRKTKVFIDQNLGYGVLGTDVAKVLFDCYGFREIYISSADADILGKPYWVKGILPKKKLLNMEWLDEYKD
ncbi:MAG: GHKL domain-containing protein [Oligoflexales bacterium]|nr:GHKL domain-containing protein [Oligoflexales bacterium]